jgi:hypothetical protein
MVLNPLEWFMWRKPEGVTLDRDYEQEIMRTALLARRADDPETAWFVAHYARDRLRLSWLYVTGAVLCTGQLVWAIVAGSFDWWHLAIVVVVLCALWYLYAHRRAFRLNEAVAKVPPGLEGRG